MESRKVHTLENGGSNPSPAISNMINSVQIDFSVYLRYRVMRDRVVRDTGLSTIFLAEVILLEKEETSNTPCSVSS